MKGSDLEQYLAGRNKSFSAAFHLIRERCAQLQDRWCSHWPEGNDHGTRHVGRVLDNLAAILGRSPVSEKALSVRELALAMTAVIAHDIGVLRGRSGHAQTSADLFKEIAAQNPLLIDKRSLPVLAAAITCHSSSVDLAAGCKGLPVELIIAGETVRPRLVAALVRLADELDEDYRRADEFEETHAEIPASSRPYWRFCQCISGIDFGKPGGDITINAQLDVEELRAPDSAPRPDFLQFFANKLAKSNRERARMSGFLGKPFARTRISVVVSPPPNLPTFETPLRFDFNDEDTADQAAEQDAANRFVARLRARAVPTAASAPRRRVARERRTAGATRRAPKSAASADDGKDPPAPVRAERSDVELQDWLSRYAKGLTQLAERLRANPTWLDDPELVDISVRERSIGEAGAGRLVRTLERAMETVEPRVVLVGEGGAGKTTLLLGVAVAMARKALEHEGAPLPLYLRLNFFDAKQRSLGGLLDALEHSSGLPEQALRAIRRGARPCCFLLDGLNEVHQDFMDGCLSAIEQLAPATGRHRCIVTSRLTPDVDELVRRIAPATILETVPLTEPQISTVLDRRGLGTVADRLGPRLAELATTPFRLSAIVKSCEGVDLDRVPLSVPQLIWTLIDDYIFTRRELQKPKDVRPTTYDYQRVKRPILAQVALQMVRKGVTRIPEDLALLETIHAQLREHEAAFHGRRVVMPKEPDSTRFLDEVVLNDILRRDGETLEFLNESVLDYYAGIGLSSLAATDIAALVPPLVWRRIDVGYDEMPVPGAFTEAIAMHVGLDVGASQLLPLVAERHPLVAARCVGAAGLDDTPAGRTLLQRWAELLLDPRPLHRWVACQCLRSAGNLHEDVGERLAELAHSDPEPFVRLVAMHALSNCARVAPVVRLIAALIAYDGTSSFDPGTNLWRLRSTQAVHTLLERWSTPPTPDRDRARIESLLATMDPDFVDDVLARIGGRAAEEARRALPEWNYLGFQASRMIREQEKARAVAEEARRRHRERLSTETLEELQRLLKEGSEDERGIALELLCARCALTVDRIFDVLRDPSPRVRARAEAALLALPSAEWCATWDERMSDAAWTILFHVPAELEEELFFELSERWVREFASRGISAKELGCVPAEPGWLLEPVGGGLEKDVYRVIHTGDRLAVIGASIRPRLAIVGAHLGERAMPTLERFLTEDPRSAWAAVVEAWGRIGTDAAIGRLAKQLGSEPLDWKVIEAIAASRHPTARALLLDVLGATRVPDGRMGVDVENRVRELSHILIDLGAANELCSLIGAMLNGSDVVRRVVAAHILLAHGAKTEHPFEDLAIRASCDPDPRVRVAGMKMLATVQDIAGREILLRACMNEPVPEVWSAACAAFRRACSDEDLLRLRQARHALDRDTRARVIGALAHVRDDSAIPDLHEAFHDPDAEIRALAADGLQRLGATQPSTQRDPSYGDR